MCRRKCRLRRWENSVETLTLNAAACRGNKRQDGRPPSPAIADARCGSAQTRTGSAYEMRNLMADQAGSATRRRSTWGMGFLNAVFSFRMTLRHSPRIHFSGPGLRPPGRPPSGVCGALMGRRGIFARMLYAGTVPPGAWRSFGKALREPVGRIHWAGTECAMPTQ